MKFLLLLAPIVLLALLLPAYTALALGSRKLMGAEAEEMGGIESREAEQEAKQEQQELEREQEAERNSNTVDGDSIESLGGGGQSAPQTVDPDSIQGLGDETSGMGGDAEEPTDPCAGHGRRLAGTFAPTGASCPVPPRQPPPAYSPEGGEGYNKEPEPGSQEELNQKRDAMKKATREYTEASEEMERTNQQFERDLESMRPGPKKAAFQESATMAEDALNDAGPVKEEATSTIGKIMSTIKGGLKGLLGGLATHALTVSEGGGMRGGGGVIVSRITAGVKSIYTHNTRPKDSQCPHNLRLSLCVCVYTPPPTPPPTPTPTPNFTHRSSC